MHILLWDQDCMVSQVFIVGKMLHEQMLYFTTVENGICNISDVQLLLKCLYHGWGFYIFIRFGTL